MSIGSTPNRQAYSGNGSTTAFSIPFAVINQTYLTVLLVNDIPGDTNRGTWVAKALTTDYTVSGDLTEPGSTLTMLVAPPTNYKLVIIGAPALTQSLVVTENSAFPPGPVTAEMDLQTRVSQYLNDEVTRAVRLPDGFTASFDPTLPKNVEAMQGYLLGLNASANGFSYINPLSVLPGVAWGNISGTLSAQSDLNTALAAKAPTASPTFTGTPAAPTASANDNSTKLATTAYADRAAASATPGANSVTNSILAQMPAHTYKGNNTGSTANAADLTATQLTAELNAMVGDSGSGGTKGLAPAPGAGDAAAGKFLKADGTYAVPAGSAGITSLTGDVTGTGPGATATTIAANAVTNAKAAQMAAHTFKGNNTGSTANAIDLTATQLTAELNAVVGDSGSGGTKGLAPAPGAGDAAAGKFLKADGTWAAPAGTGTVTTVSVVSANGLAGSVANATSTPAITLSTSVTGMLKGNGTAISAATSADLPTITLTGDVTGAASGGSVATTYANTVPINKGGTGQTSANAAFNALSPMTTQGDIIYGGASGAGTRLAAGSANQALTFLGSQTSPSWNTLYQENVPNYINANPNAEVDTTGWATYANTAANIPSTGTGGTATNLTFSRSTSSPLRGTGSFSMVQANSTSLQGKGVSYDFTIDSADQTQVLTIKFDYNASSTFVASNGTTTPLNDGTTSTNAGNSDIEVFIYDKTNSVLIPVSPQTIVGNGSNNFTFQGSFQAASNSTSYRLIFHVATTSANATGWTFKFDNVSVRPNTYNMGAAVTAWTAYSPTLSAGFGTTTNASFFYRRVGDSVEVMGSFTAGTVAASLATITLPSGLSLDTTKISLANTTSNSGPTMGDYWNTEASGFGSIVTATGTSSSLLYFGNLSANSTNTIPQNGNTILTSSTNVSLKFRVPVSGWGVTQVLSSDTDTRVVSAILTNSSNLSMAAGTLIINTASYDTHGAYNASTGVYTVPVSGFYTCTGSSLTLTGAGTEAIGFQKNSGTNIYVWTFSGTGTIGGGATQFYCTAGDTIKVVGSGSGSSLSSGAQFSITRVSGPAQVAASEKIYLQYTGNGGTSLTANTTNIDFSTKVIDSHGAWNGTTFTAPRAGWFDIKGHTQLTTSSTYGLYVYVNTVQKLLTNTDVSNNGHNFSGGIYLNAGDAVTLRSNTNGTLSNNATNHWVAITGN